MNRKRRQLGDTGSGDLLHYFRSAAGPSNATNSSDGRSELEADQGIRQSSSSDLPTMSEPVTSYSSSQESELSCTGELHSDQNGSANSEPAELFTSGSENENEHGNDLEELEPVISDVEEAGNEPEVHAAIRSGDFGKVVKLKQERRLTDQEKYLLLTQYSVAPPDNFMFPTRIINGARRHFQRSWLTKYNGLVYSESENGGYCKFCVLFGKCGPSVKELGVLVDKPFTNFKKSSDKLGEHFFGLSKGARTPRGKKYHEIALKDSTAFVACMKKRDLRIDHRLSLERDRRVKENQQKLQPIAETIIFCGRQAIALRGHRDDSSAIQDDPMANHGNFYALLQFRIQSGDEVLKKHLDTAPKNGLYTSKTIQNQMITISGDIIRNKILCKVRQSRFFSVIADEATDIANIEQLSISVRYVDSETLTVCEKFLAFLKCESGVTGEALADAILQQLTEWQLHPYLLRGQAYDGAGAMAGKSKGVAARICTKYPKAIYTHCASHRLNLCVVKCCEIKDVSNMMNAADTISRFFSNSPKRQLALEKWINDLFSEEKRKKMKELCRTRWVERHDAFEVFIDLYLPTVSCFEEIARSRPADWNRDTRSDAQSLLLSMSQFPFVIALVLTQKVLAYTKGLSVKLQGRYVDVVYAHQEIETVKATLKDVRKNVDRFHSLMYSQVLLLCETVGIEETVPRLASRQRHRQNIPASDSKEYYKRVLTIPLLDHLLCELDSRFDENSSKLVVEFIQFLPSEIAEQNSSLQVDAIPQLIQMYKDDLPSFTALDAEIDLWNNKWANQTELAPELVTPEKTLAHIDQDFFPNIYTLFLLMTTLPVTSCECERSISMLRLLKTSLRSTMSEDRLNGLAMLQYHRDVPLTADEVIQEFSVRHSRRLLLVNPLDD